jgi:hypothetical protein
MEIVNKTLQQYLRCFVHDKPKQWGQFLPWAEWHYNTAVHTSTGFSPFQVVYGRPPPSLVDYIPGSTPLQAVDATLTNRDEILQILKHKLLKAQATMKEYADQHRTPHQFKIGDFVFVKLRPYRQNSVLGRRFHKLSKRFYGPFKLVRAIGDVAFQVELPATSRIHPVFHVSQMKPCFDVTTYTLALPPEAIDNQPILKPLAVLDWKKGTTEDQNQVLIQWEGLYPEDATWECCADMRTNYPNFDLVDKVSFEGYEDVMSDEEVELQDLGPDAEEMITPPLRAKRNIVRPKWLSPYEVTPLNRRGRK